MAAINGPPERKYFLAIFTYGWFRVCASELDLPWAYCTSDGRNIYFVEDPALVPVTALAYTETRRITRREALGVLCLKSRLVPSPTAVAHLAVKISGAERILEEYRFLEDDYRAEMIEGQIARLKRRQERAILRMTTPVPEPIPHARPVRHDTSYWETLDNLGIHAHTPVA